MYQVRGVFRDYFEVGVIGYGARAGPAFGGALLGRALVQISEVANQPARIEEWTRKVEDGAGGLAEQKIKFPIWFDPVANGGTPMCQALELAYQILAEWVRRHPQSYPPIMVNITDGEATDGDPTERAQRLMNLSTQDGNALVFNCHISSQAAAPTLFPNNDNGLPDEFAKMLYKMSSVLTDTLRTVAQGEGFQVGDQARGFAFNADLVDVVRFLDIGTRPSSLQLR